MKSLARAHRDVKKITLEKISLLTNPSELRLQFLLRKISEQCHLLLKIFKLPEVE